MVPVTDRGEGADRSVAEALQHGAAAFESRLSHAGRVRGEAREARRNGRPSDGADRCGIWGLRAPPRRTTAPQGANERSNRGGRLKLNVVRRNKAGHCLFGATMWACTAHLLVVRHYFKAFGTTA